MPLRPQGTPAHSGRWPGGSRFARSRRRRSAPAQALPRVTELLTSCCVCAAEVWLHRCALLQISIGDDIVSAHASYGTWWVS